MFYDELNHLHTKMNLTNLPMDGTTHNEDALYIFSPDRLPIYKSLRSNDELGKAIIKYRKFLVNFVKYG